MAAHQALTVDVRCWQVGEFQCYDRRALASLAQAARDAGQPEWGYGGPHDAGTYNSTPEVSCTESFLRTIDSTL